MNKLGARHLHNNIYLYLYNDIQLYEALSHYHVKKEKVTINLKYLNISYKIQNSMPFLMKLSCFTR